MFGETPWLEEESQMDAEWLSGTRRKRKQRRDAGSSKKWAPDSLFNMMPEYVNVKQHLRWPCGGSEHRAGRQLEVRQTRSERRSCKLQVTQIVRFLLERGLRFRNLGFCGHGLM